MSDDLFIFVMILFGATGAVIWCVVVPGALLLAVGHAVLRAVRRRRERSQEAATVEQAAWEAIDEGLTRQFDALGPPPDTRGEER